MPPKVIPAILPAYVCYDCGAPHPAPLDGPALTVFSIICPVCGEYILSKVARAKPRVYSTD